MYLQQLTTYQFRNLENTTVKLSKEINLFVGKNGQGKTNFVEALSVLSTGRSFRTSISKELIRIGEKEASVFGEVSSQEGQEKIGIVLGSKENKQYFVNSEKVQSLDTYLGKLICVSFSPTDVSLVKGAPQGRRKFIDKLLVELYPTLLEAYGNYQRALKNKQALLKAREGLNASTLAPWNALLLEHGSKIIFERQKIIGQLSIELSQTMQNVAPQDGQAEVSLESEIKKITSVEEIREEFFQKLERVIEQEINYGSTKVGPHLDDMSIELGGKDSRSFASQGQARSLVIAIKLASMSLIEKIKKISPVLILDDVDSELDNQRINTFLELLISDKRQTFITGTEIPKYILENTKEKAEFFVDSGKIV